MVTAEQMPAGPHSAEIVTSPLVERIRRGIIGEDDLLALHEIQSLRPQSRRYDRPGHGRGLQDLHPRPAADA